MPGRFVCPPMKLVFVSSRFDALALERLDPLSLEFKACPTKVSSPLAPDPKDIDRLDAGVVEHSAGQAASVHERGVEVDAVGSQVRLLDRRVAVDDILFVRPPMSQERAANPELSVSVWSFSATPGRTPA